MCMHNGYNGYYSYLPTASPPLPQCAATRRLVLELVLRAEDLAVMTTLLIETFRGPLLGAPSLYAYISLCM